MRVSRPPAILPQKDIAAENERKEEEEEGRTVFLFLWQKEEEEAKKGIKSGGRGSLRPSLSTARKRRLWKNRRGRGERERGGSNFWPKRGRRREGKDRTQNKWHFFPGKLLGFPFLLDAAAAAAPSLSLL